MKIIKENGRVIHILGDEDVIYELDDMVKKKKKKLAVTGFPVPKAYFGDTRKEVTERTRIHP
jgi:hypothetical protein